MGEPSGAVVRYTWMFRAAAVVFLLFGLFALWRFGFTDYHPEQRPWGLGFGILEVAVGLSLFRRAKWAIAVSAGLSAIVSISAAVFAPTVRGPGILFLALVAIVFGLYAALALREAFGRS